MLFKVIITESCRLEKILRSSTDTAQVHHYRIPSDRKCHKRMQIYFICTLPVFQNSKKHKYWNICRIPGSFAKTLIIIFFLACLFFEKDPISPSELKPSRQSFCSGNLITIILRSYSFCRTILFNGLRYICCSFVSSI